MASVPPLITTTTVSAGIEREIASGDCGGAGVGIGTGENEVACAGFRETAAAGDGAGKSVRTGVVVEERGGTEVDGAGAGEGEGLVEVVQVESAVDADELAVGLVRGDPGFQGGAGADENGAGDGIGAVRGFFEFQKSAIERGGAAESVRGAAGEFDLGGAVNVDAAGPGEDAGNCYSLIVCSVDIYYISFCVNRSGKHKVTGKRIEFGGTVVDGDRNIESLRAGGVVFDFGDLAAVVVEIDAVGSAGLVDRASSCRGGKI